MDGSRDEDGNCGSNITVLYLKKPFWWNKQMVSDNN